MSRVIKMEMELQKINNIVIIANDTVIGNESVGATKVRLMLMTYVGDLAEVSCSDQHPITHRHLNDCGLKKFIFFRPS